MNTSATSARNLFLNPMIRSPPLVLLRLLSIERPCSPTAGEWLREKYPQNRGSQYEYLRHNRLLRRWEQSTDARNELGLISARQSTLQIRLGSDCVSHRTQPAARAFHSARIFCAPTCAYVLLSTRFALTGHEVRWLPAIRPVRHLSVVICRMTGPIVRPSVPSRLASQSA